MDWSEFLTEQSQDLIGAKVEQAIAPQAPVAKTAGGLQYREGKPVVSMPVLSGLKPIMGIQPKIYLAIAALVVLGGGYYMFKK